MHTAGEEITRVVLYFVCSCIDVGNYRNFSKILVVQGESFKSCFSQKQASLLDTKAPFIGTQMFLNPQLFLSPYGFRQSTRYPVNSAAYPDIFEPALQSGKK